MYFLWSTSQHSNLFNIAYTSKVLHLLDDEYHNCLGKTILNCSYKHICKMFMVNFIFSFTRNYLYFFFQWHLCIVDCLSSGLNAPVEFLKIKCNDTTGALWSALRELNFLKNISSIEYCSGILPRKWSLSVNWIEDDSDDMNSLRIKLSNDRSEKYKLWCRLMNISLIM